MLDSVPVNLFYLLKYQSLSNPWLLTVPAPPVNKIKLTSTISSSHKALITFCQDDPNSPAPNFLESLVNALSATIRKESAKHTCKGHTASSESSHYLLLIIFFLFTVSC